MVLLQQTFWETGHSSPILPHNLFKTDKERSVSQGPCKNCNFITSMGLNFNSFGIHLSNVICWFLVAQTKEKTHIHFLQQNVKVYSLSIFVHSSHTNLFYNYFYFLVFLFGSYTT